MVTRFRGTVLDRAVLAKKCREFQQLEPLTADGAGAPLRAGRPCRGVGGSCTACERPAISGRPQSRRRAAAEADPRKHEERVPQGSNDSRTVGFGKRTTPAQEPGSLPAQREDRTGTIGLIWGPDPSFGPPQSFAGDLSPRLQL